MSEAPYGVTIFCDDIRNEVAGKMTLVGCYQSEMNFNAPPPGVLPTFAALVNIRVPMSMNFEKLTLRVYDERDREVNEILKTEAVLPADAKVVRAPEGVEAEGPQMAHFTFPLRWSPVQFAGPSVVKVRGYLDGEREIKAGTLVVNFPSDSAFDEPKGGV